jgi:hypothetical protein
MKKKLAIGLIALCAIAGNVTYLSAQAIESGNCPGSTSCAKVAALSANMSETPTTPEFSV